MLASKKSLNCVNQKTVELRLVMEKDCDGNEIEALILDTLRKQMIDSGKMKKIESEVRTMVLNEIRGGDKSPLSLLPGKNENSPTQIVNNLILEYLEWMNFQYTKETFVKESGVENSPSRVLIEAQVGVKDINFDKDLPLLMTLIMKMTQK